MTTNKQKPQICLLGASFDTGNLGVNSLAEASIKCILHKWPDAEVILLDSERQPGQSQLQIGGKNVTIYELPIRFSKNIFLPNHFCVLLMYALLLKLFPNNKIKTALAKRNPYLKRIIETDLVVDITGGDSFSDIYGLRRFIFVFLSKLLPIEFGKKLFLLPQTYGPFNSAISKVLAKYILKRAAAIYSRDKASIEYLRDFLNSPDANSKMRCLPDVAFVLDPSEPEHIDTTTLKNIKAKNTILIGLNVSGLLYNGGYTRNNMFGLKTDYRKTIEAVIDLLMKYNNTVVLLVPHVFPPAELHVESDPRACSIVYESASRKYKGRVFLVSGTYNHNESKYIVGLCDFFIGSRMHSCIEALSQFIPAVGLGYSKKFYGVFETVGVQQFALDMRQLETDQILTSVTGAFEQRQKTSDHLKLVIPEIQKQILNLFEDIL
jgi:polysaccharide pyruvyl transferase WcaK-like protein